MKSISQYLEIENHRYIRILSQ